MLLLLGLILPMNFALACWKLEGSLAIDGETWKINSKIDHDKEYIFPMGVFILKLMITRDQSNKKFHTINYAIHEKKGASVLPITIGEEEEVELDKSKQIYAKGGEGRPHSIITIKLKDL